MYWPSFKIEGDGPYATRLWCSDEPTVTLFATEDEAQEARALADMLGCCARCASDTGRRGITVYMHQVWYLAERRRIERRPERKENEPGSTP
jgi:hypothetical protein